MGKLCALVKTARIDAGDTASWLRRHPVFLASFAILALGFGAAPFISDRETLTPAQEHPPPESQSDAGTAGPAERSTSAALVLPDLVPTPPSVVILTGSGDGAVLRFPTSISNLGAGPMQIQAGLSPDSGRTTAYQVIERSDGTTIESLAGVMALDPEHGHWHLSDFALFELWRTGADGGIEARVAIGQKITFCLMDQFPASEEEIPTEPVYAACDWREQGISPGWSETYALDLPGQELEIGDLPDGDYVLITTIDPDNRLRESNDSNNTSRITIHLADGIVTIVSPP
jgi:hypothetical protein